MEESVKTIVLHISSGREIVIRPKRHGECPASHPIRIVVSKFPPSQGSMIHLVRHTTLKLEQALVFEPEKNWKKCPCCQNKGWSAWMPVQVHYRDIWPDGSQESYPSVQWYIICRHCASIVTVHDFEPFAVKADEYVYDPTDDIPMRWAGWKR